jgi:phycocyanin-associated, rod
MWFRIPEFSRLLEKNMNVIPISGVSDYANRLFSLEVQSCNQNSASRTSNYFVKVSFSCLSQTIQSIHRLGDSVMHVTTLSPTFSRTNTHNSAPAASAQEGKASETTDKGGRTDKPKSKK